MATSGVMLSVVVLLTICSVYIFIVIVLCFCDIYIYIVNYIKCYNTK